MLKFNNAFVCATSWCFILLVVCEGRSIEPEDDGEVVYMKSHAVTNESSFDGDYSASHLRTRRAISLSAKEKQAVVDRHNHYRRNEGAAHMQKMKWNDNLANMAAEWVDKCVWKHGQPNRNPEEMPFQKIGQNMAASKEKKDLKWSVDSYFAEKKFYNFDRNSCESGKECEHYTQVVWSSTTDVGCAYALCNKLENGPSSSPTWFFVCNYGPAGNTRTCPIKPPIQPYQKGSACSLCDGEKWCDAGLCNSECVKSNKKCECAAECKNCGKVDPKTCTCKCPKGFAGGDCAAPCKEQEFCKNIKGLGAIVCKTASFWANTCSISCGLCEEGPVDKRTCPVDRISPPYKPKST